MLFPLRVWWCFGRKVFVDDDVIARTPIARTLYHIITSSQSIRKSSKTRKKERKKEKIVVVTNSREKEEKREKSAANNEVPKIFSAFSVASRFGSPATTKGMNAILSSDFNRSNVSPMDATPSSFVAMRVVLPPRLFDGKKSPPFRCEPVLLVLCRDAQEQQLLLLPGADVVDMVSHSQHSLIYNVDKMTLNKKKKRETKKSPKYALGTVPHADSKRVYTVHSKESSFLDL